MDRLCGMERVNGYYSLQTPVARSSEYSYDISWRVVLAYLGRCSNADQLVS